MKIRSTDAGFLFILVLAVGIVASAVHASPLKAVFKKQFVAVDSFSIRADGIPVTLTCATAHKNLTHYVASKSMGKKSFAEIDILRLKTSLKRLKGRDLKNGNALVKDWTLREQKCAKGRALFNVVPTPTPTRIATIAAPRDELPLLKDVALGAVPNQIITLSPSSLFEKSMTVDGTFVVDAPSGIAVQIQSSTINLTAFAPGLFELPVYFQSLRGQHSNSVKIRVLVTPESSAANKTARPVTLHSQTVDPGSVAELVGDFSGFIDEKIFLVSGASLVQLEVVSAKNNIILFKMPTAGSISNVPQKVFVQDAGHFSQAVYLNAPNISFATSQEMAPGQSVTIYGKNLALGGLNPAISLNHEITAVVEESNNNLVKFRIPSTATVTQGKKYTINLDTLAQVDGSTTDSSFTLSGITSAADPYNLDVSWASQITYLGDQTKVYNIKTDPRLPTRAAGNGITDDRNTIQNALNFLSTQGGGVLFFPSGTYRVLDDGMNGKQGLRIPSNVTLKGVDAASSKIIFNEQPCDYNDSHCWDAGIQINGDNIGFMSLTLEGKNTTTTINAGIHPDWLHHKNLFFRGVTYTTGSNNGTQLYSIENFSIRDSTINGQMIGLHVFTANECSYGDIQRNLVKYRTSRFVITSSAHVELRDNSFERDGNYIGQYESGGTELSMNDGLGVSRNTYDIFNATTGNDVGSGEAIMAQRSTWPQYTSDGIISSATATTVSDTVINDGKQVLGHIAWTTLPKTMTTYDVFFPDASNTTNVRQVVQILSGKGVGQWREISRYDDKTLYLAKPFDIVPEPGDTYAIGYWPAKDYFIIDNNLFNQTGGGLVIWQGALNVTYARNNLVNSGALTVRCTNYYNTAEGLAATKETLPCWNTDISDNLISNSYVNRSSIIQFYVNRIGRSAFGEQGIAMNNEARGNMLVGLDNTTTNNMVLLERSGLRTYVYLERLPPNDNRCVTQNFGTIFEGNAKSGFAKLYLSLDDLVPYGNCKESVKSYSFEGSAG